MQTTIDEKQSDVGWVLLHVFKMRSLSTPNIPWFAGQPRVANLKINQ